ncbi:AEC family transporter [Halorubellus sp. JP-L1]|uniref:AEC family transporter n=1 Tax=Halorubellus sp. JP-L1 TaxID=2715753 RepID=UPI00140AE7AD|nr:AEC family transporter [Halorubellus sp. JP-L1]NHN42512.1 AEC family transporter [Halorubellus sp. JP-L1]
MDLAGRFAYMFLLVAVGLGARRLGVLTGSRNERLGQLAFYVFLPALIFVSTYDEDLAELLSVELVAGMLAVIAVLVALSWSTNRRGPDDVRSVALVQSYHSNFGYFGVPVVAATLGSTAAATASVIFGLGAVIQIPLTVLVLVTINDTEAAVGHEVRSVVTNPILLTLAVSLCFATLGLSVPSPVVGGLERVSTLALPVALVAVGGSLTPADHDVSLGSTATVVGLKVLVMPLVAWLVFSGLGTGVLTRNAAVVMFGAPTAVSTYVYATELGGDTEFASMNVFVTTLASIISLFVVLQFLT